MAHGPRPLHVRTSSPGLGCRNQPSLVRPRSGRQHDEVFCRASLVSGGMVSEGSIGIVAGAGGNLPPARNLSLDAFQHRLATGTRVADVQAPLDSGYVHCSLEMFGARAITALSGELPNRPELRAPQSVGRFDLFPEPTVSANWSSISIVASPTQRHRRTHETC